MWGKENETFSTAIRSAHRRKSTTEVNEMKIKITGKVIRKPDFAKDFRWLNDVTGDFDNFIYLKGDMVKITVEVKGKMRKWKN